MQSKIITHINFAKGFRGGERQTQILVEQLSSLGYKQKLLVRKNSELTARCKDIKNLKIIEISKPYIFHLTQIKDSVLLHAHETKALQFAYFSSKLLNIPYIVTRRVGNKVKTNFLNKRMYSSATVSVAISKVIQKEIIRVSPDANTDIVFDAFSDDTINEIESTKIKQRFKNKFLVGNIGALDDNDKGQSFLIEAARSLEKSHPEIHFIFLGRGKDEQMFKAQAKGMNNITFEGFVNNVNDYIKCFDLFVFPSRNEGLGSILLDVMQQEIPIIASNVGGIPDIITDKKNGILIQPCNVKEIETNIIDLYKCKEKRELLASNAKEFVHKYSPLNMAKSYIKIYNKINNFYLLP